MKNVIIEVREAGTDRILLWGQATLVEADRWLELQLSTDWRGTIAQVSGPIVRDRRPIV